jgi:hypothetical protein
MVWCLIKQEICSHGMHGTHLSTRETLPLPSHEKDFSCLALNCFLQLKFMIEIQAVACCDRYIHLTLWGLPILLSIEYQGLFPWG